MAEQRSLPVPEGLEGERLDAALSRLFGFSRTRAAELIVAGDVLVDGALAAKSDRVHGGRVAGGDAAAAARRADAGAEPIPGMKIVYEDDDIVVVNKPIGVAAHPTVGWTGQTVIGGLLGAGHRVSTSGAAERQGIVHRLDANTTGAMVVAKSEHAYSHLKRAFKERTVEKHYHALVQGHPDPSRGTVDAPIDRHPSGDGRWAVVAGGKRFDHPLRHDRGVPRGVPAGRQAGDGPDPPDPGSHVGAAPPVRRRPDVRRGPHAVRAPGHHPAVAARGLPGLRAPVDGGVGHLHHRISGGPVPRPEGPGRRVLEALTGVRRTAYVPEALGGRGPGF